MLCFSVRCKAGLKFIVLLPQPPNTGITREPIFQCAVYYLSLV
jgi:hypothetical protein